MNTVLPARERPVTPSRTPDPETKSAKLRAAMPVSKSRSEKLGKARLGGSRPCKHAPGQVKAAPHAAERYRNRPCRRDTCCVGSAFAVRQNAAAHHVPALAGCFAGAALVRLHRHACGFRLAASFVILAVYARELERL